MYFLRIWNNFDEKENIKYSSERIEALGFTLKSKSNSNINIKGFLGNNHSNFDLDLVTLETQITQRKKH